MVLEIVRVVDEWQVRQKSILKWKMHQINSTRSQLCIERGLIFLDSAQ